MLVLDLAPAGATEPRTVTLDYAIWTGGLQALSLKTRMVRDPENYRVEAIARTEGFIGRLFPFKMAAETQGRMHPGQGLAALRPSRYGVRSNWQDKDRRVQMRYGRDGPPQVSVLPAPEEDDRDAIPAEQIAGTLDPMSAILAMIERTAEIGRCEGEFAVFDGRRRYDMVLRHIGPAKIEANDFSSYAGPAMECRAGMKRLGGFWRNPKRQERDFGEVKVFLAPLLDGMPLLPVRLEAKSDYLGVRIHVTDAKLHDGVTVTPAGLGF